MSGAGDEVQTGIIKFYNPRKGYGFVTRADGNDVFFHLSHFQTPTAPVPGNVVQFLLGQNREGLTAEEMVIVPSDTIECYGGTITELEAEGGVVATPDNFEIRFSRADFIPHTRAEALRVGDEVEMNFLEQDESAVWRAKVIKAPGFQPEAATARGERRDGDEEEENRRLLGILYKTDLDDEALQAAQTLAERNMRATLSALVSRVFDRRFELATRRTLVGLVAAIYFDDECQAYLEQMTSRLALALDEDETEGSPAATRALTLLLDDEQFPVRWSQYLLPFGLSLLRNLAGVPSCHSLLEEAETIAAAETWLTRVCRHVEQRRSGYGYVMTTALSTFDDIWHHEELQPALRRVLARLLVAVDGEGLANQIYHLRDKLSPHFLPVLLPLVSQHPDLPAALRAPAQSEIFAQWIETVLRASGDTLPTETLAAVLPLIEEVRTHLTDDSALQRLLRPVTENLTADELVRMLTAEDLPERAVWACFRYLERQGQLAEVLSEPEIRGKVTDWLRRTSASAAPALPREQEVNTALKLIDSLRGSAELSGELSDIGQTLFSGIHGRLAQAGSDELLTVLDQLDVGGLPGLSKVLAVRLVDDELNDVARQRLLQYFAEVGGPAAAAATALAAWRAERDSVPRIDALITQGELCDGGNEDAAGVARVIEQVLTEREIGWHDGFVTDLVDLPIGGKVAALEGFAIRVPQRLFVDPADFGPNRFVRLIHRRGMALGVVSAPVPEGATICGRLAGPLYIDERNAMVGALIDAEGEVCFFEVAQMRSGRDRALQEGELMRFGRLPAAGEQPYRYVAFNVHAEFTADDWPTLAATVVQAADEQVALAAARVALSLDEPAVTGWAELLAELPESRRAALLASVEAADRERLAALVP